MKVHFTPEQEARIAEVAEAEGLDAEAFVKRAGLRLLTDEEVRKAVQKGINEADRGEFIEEKEMDVRIEKMLRT
jgi:predicted transcriptional regulator